MKKSSFVLAISCLLLGGCKENPEVNNEKRSFQLLSGDLLTTLPGKLVVMDKYLVWEDSFSRDYFVHVHDKISGDTIGRMGKVGEGPEEFVTGGIGFSCKADHPEHFNKAITVYCNAAESPLKLKITGSTE